jgi:uncharacterized membrane protein
MAAFSYLLLPLTGLIVYFGGRDVRARFHGLQAIAFGLLWALALYGAAAVSPRLTQVLFAAGGLTWAVLFGATALGRDPALPVLGRLLRRAAEGSPGS